MIHGQLRVHVCGVDVKWGRCCTKTMFSFLWHLRVYSATWSVAPLQPSDQACDRRKYTETAAAEVWMTTIMTISTTTAWQRLDSLVQEGLLYTYTLIGEDGAQVIPATQKPLLRLQDAQAAAACLQAPCTASSLSLHIQDRPWQLTVVKQNDWELLAVARQRRLGLAAFRLRCGVLVVCWHHPVQPQVANAAVQAILRGEGLGAASISRYHCVIAPTGGLVIKT